MPTLNKLEYLDETKQEIKTALNTNFNSGITDEDTFRSYVTKIDNIYTNWPKVTGEGTEITLSNTKKGRMPLKPKGNTEQDSYTGKNLFNYNIIDVSTITIDNDGTILISDTESSNGYTSTSKTLSQLCPSLQVGDTVYLYLESDWTLRQYIYSSALGNWSNGQSRTITQEMLDGRIILYGGYQTTSHLKIMITNQLETSFEPYVGGTASPNPDYPQPIRVVKGDNTIKVTGKNLCTNSENFSGGAVYLYFNPKSINKTVTISLISDVDAENSNIFLFGGNTNLGNLGSSNRINLVANQKAYATITIPDDIYNQMLNYDTANFSLYKSGAGHDTSKAPLEAQIENNLSYTGYQPYQEQTYPLNLGTTEVCDQDYFTRDNKKIWGITKAIGKVVLNGSEADWSLSTAGGLNRYLYPLQNPVLSTSCISSHFKGVPYGTHQDYGCYVGATGRLALYYNSITTVEAFKTWLSNNPVTVYYVLATPTGEEIGLPSTNTLAEQLEALYNAMSVDGTNIITSTYEEGNAPVIINATALMKGGN